MRHALWLSLLALVPAALAQERQTLPLKQDAPAVSRQLDDGSYLLAAGTRIPLSLMNTVSSKNAAPGDQLYLQTMVPVAVGGQIVIPVGTYVMGTITKSVRPGKVKGRGELAMRFDRIMFGDGSSFDLTGQIGAMDGGNPGELDRREGKVTSDGAVGRDAMVTGGTAMAGAATGHWIGGEGRDAAIGAGAGAAAGVAAVLLTRGPEAVLQRGSTVEMLLNTDLRLPPGRAQRPAKVR